MDFSGFGKFLSEIDRGTVFLIAMGMAFPFLIRYLAKTVGLDRLWRGITNIFGNWQLALLGATSLVLSLASGWTTWDGMRNFTREPVLSLMATFGIQGVMLICAWLIGETFARGATGETDRVLAARTGPMTRQERFQRFEQGARNAAHSSKLPSLVLLAAIALLAFAAVSAYFLKLDDISDLPRVYGTNAVWVAVSLGTVLLVAFVLMAFSNAEILGPYARGLRVILANLHLWVMLLICMGISVFFSFDSLFSTIFPAGERARAADLRAQNQVAGLVTELGSFVKKRRIEESARLFETQGWKDYDEQLHKLNDAAQGADEAIKQYFIEKMNQRTSGIKEQQERIATATGGQAGLADKKAALTVEVNRLRTHDLPALTEAYGKAKAARDERLSQKEAKRIEAQAEGGGVEGTGKVGRGPEYRKRVDELARLEEGIKIDNERLKVATKDYDGVNTRIAQIERELAAIDGQLGKLKADAENAGQRIKINEESLKTDDAPKVDPTTALVQLERARTDFRTLPEAARLANIQQLCSGLAGAMASTDATRAKVAGIDCDPKSASEAAARVFALNAGLSRYEEKCAGGDKLPVASSTDKYLEYGASCVQESGLPGPDSAKLRDKLNGIALNRDDKAHRFVVTWNAFLDGNRLAYLALSIAIALDGLVFMSGLFGANAIASPLANTPEARNRSVGDLQKVIDSALRPDKLYAADLTVNLMEPIRLPNDPKFTVFVDLNPMEDEHQRFTVRKVLTAGSGLGLVKQFPQARHAYLVRKELHEYLLLVSEIEHRRGEDAPRQSAIPILDMARALPGLPHGDHGPYAHASAHYQGHGAGPRDITPPQAQLPPGPRHAAIANYAAPGPDPDQGRAARQRYAGTPEPQRFAPALPPRSAPRQPPVRQGPSNPTWDQIYEAFFRALKLSGEDYQLLSNVALVSDMDAAVFELTNLCIRYEELANRISALQQERSDAIDRTCDNILRAGQFDPGAQQEIIDKSLQLRDEILPRSLLIRDGGYERVVRQIVRDHEEQAGKGKLSEREHDRFELLQAHLADLSDAKSDRRSVDGWQTITFLIRKLAQDLSEVGAIEGHGAQAYPAGHG